MLICTSIIRVLLGCCLPEPCHSARLKPPKLLPIKLSFRSFVLWPPGSRLIPDFSDPCLSTVRAPPPDTARGEPPGLSRIAERLIGCGFCEWMFMGAHEREVLFFVFPKYSQLSYRKQWRRTAVMCDHREGVEGLIGRWHDGLSRWGWISCVVTDFQCR